MVPQPAKLSQIQQFLSSILSQRGPSALPYTEDCKWLIRQHLLNLISDCPSLEPNTSTYTHNDGRSVNLLRAEGTIPMLFQGTTYNIPVLIWLLESYPRHPPCVYVNPTADMIIKRPHAHVTPSGLVSVPYVQNWVHPSSNLVDLVRELSNVFARDPPLFSRRPTQITSPPSLSSASSSSSVGSGYGSGYGPTPRPTPPPRNYPPSPYQQNSSFQHQHPQHSGTDEAAEVFKRNAVTKLVEMVHGDLGAMRKTREAETDGLLSTQGGLRRREDEINRGLKEMQDEKEGLEEQLQVVLMNTAILESWLKDNEDKKNKATQNLTDGDNVDNAFECVDSLSKQMLDCTAADLGIEDLVYALDKAVQDGAIPFDQYLRNIRLLSREQFFQRATAAKVRGVQMHAQVSNMAARSQQHYVS